MEARGRAQVTSTPCALHNMLLNFNTNRRALILADTLHRRMYGAAGTIHEPPSPSTAERAQPTTGAQRVFQLLRPHKQMRTIYEMEEREAAHVHRPGPTPTDGRERGKHNIYMHVLFTFMLSEEAKSNHSISSQ